jgi:hypothetical protein
MPQDLLPGIVFLLWFGGKNPNLMGGKGCLRQSSFGKNQKSKTLSKAALKLDHISIRYR